jgi:hypothetical protein
MAKVFLSAISRRRAWAQPALLFSLLMAQGVALPNPAQAQQELLPRRPDVAENFSTVICPDEAAARRMLDEFHVPGSGWFDTSLFMRGLGQTRCEQKGGPVRITTVLQRKTLVPGQIESVYVLYRGERPDGSPVFGIVHEYGNDTFPRTPEERWMKFNTKNGMVQAGQNRRKTYVCETAQQARRVVAAIPAIRGSERGKNATRLIAARDKALEQERGCRLVSGSQYRVVAIHEKAFISLGPDAGEEWTALSVTDSTGRTLGLLYDSGEL